MDITAVSRNCEDQDYTSSVISGVADRGETGMIVFPNSSNGTVMIRFASYWQGY